MKLFFQILIEFIFVSFIHYNDFHSLIIKYILESVVNQAKIIHITITMLDNRVKAMNMNDKIRFTYITFFKFKTR